jgi:hypothetical protein
MTTDSLFIEKREDLKRRLAAGEYKTLVGVFLEWFERLLRKIVRRKEPIPLWLTTLALWIIIFVVTNAAIYFSGAWESNLRNGELYGFGYQIGFLINTSNGALFVIMTVFIHQYLNQFFILWRDIILDKTVTLESLEKFEDWLIKCCNWRAHFFTTIIFTAWSFFAGSLFGGALPTPTIQQNGFGFIFTNFVNFVITSLMIYEIIMVIFLYASLRNYDLKLFAADPGNTELLARLSNKLGFFVYVIALFIAILSFWISRIGLLASSFGIFVIIIWWFPIITLFILYQTSLASVIRRAKWKTLNEIQSQVEELRATNNLKDKETMEAINRLMDFHDRVKATRNSAIDSTTIVNFINSLLLPLLAFILGNLDKVLLFFSKKP